MGRQRSIAEIKAIESGEVPLNAMSTSIETELKSPSKTKQLNCGMVLKDFDCNYDAYLNVNPSVKAWADANPLLAEKERLRLGAYSKEEIEQREQEEDNSMLNNLTSLGAIDS